MKPVKLFITDQRMLELMDYCIANKVSDITMIKEWCILVGLEPQNLAKVRKGERSFTNEQLLSASKQFNVSMEWLFGFVDQMFRAGSNLNPMQMLKQAVRLIDKEMQSKDRGKNLKQKLKHK